eukprot:gnl/TRDRNA2_/TRDRNA2_128054_c0_seq2.p1 gnl/TRDRNA2_/TRDRNA2_128054_c0~~gnl/TRDRNA2_/TRDRNA2_128054_c0_seq2.p1  ORF type:complete len:358 (+),score=45.16 gnl/TRDRNA2_/TRDRNA2_128054_c0_seq2:71-1144(+)
MSRCTLLILLSHVCRFAALLGQHAPTDTGCEDLRIQNLYGHRDRVRSVDFAADGSKVATASDDHTARIWSPTGTSVQGDEPKQWHEVRNFTDHDSTVRCISFSPDGHRMATGSYDQTAKIWDIAGDDPEQWRVMRTFTGHAEGVWCVAFSPDGSRVATTSADGTAKIWNIASEDPDQWHELRTLLGHDGPVWWITFSADGKRFSADGTMAATGSSDWTSKIWNVVGNDPQQWREVRTLKGHEGPVWSVAFSADGTKAATASHDETAKIWDVTAADPEKWHETAKIWDVTAADPEKWHELRTLGNEDDGGGICCVAFSADSAMVATASQDSTVTFWNMTKVSKVEDIRKDLGDMKIYE